MTLPNFVEISFVRTKTWRSKNSSTSLIKFKCHNAIHSKPADQQQVWAGFKTFSYLTFCSPILYSFVMWLSDCVVMKVLCWIFSKIKNNQVDITVEDKINRNKQHSIFNKIIISKLFSRKTRFWVLNLPQECFQWSDQKDDQIELRYKTTGFRKKTI